MGSDLSEIIDLHADGSFSAECGLGAWAFTVPSLNLEGVGSSQGSSVARFEFLAVLHGLEAVITAGDSKAAIHVYSDCETTVGAIQQLIAGRPLEKPERYQDRADLLPRLEAVIAKRHVLVTKYGKGKLEHKMCHRNAIRKLREEVHADPRGRHRVVLTRHEARFVQLAKEREALLDRLEKVAGEMALLDLEIDAIKLSMRAASVGATT